MLKDRVIQICRMDASRRVEVCYLLTTQVVLLLILFNFKGMFSPPQCSERSSNQALRRHHSGIASSVWYYEHVFKHQQAKLRILTAKDGAAPLRSSIPPLEREITITSGTTRERLSTVESTAMTWGGAFCLAVHVLDEEEIPSLYEQLKEMHARVEAHGRCRLDIQLIKEDGPKEQVRHMYPINGMRNIAWRMATTKLIFLLDADFTPSPGMHETLTKDEEMYEYLVKKATQERQLFVVPAFEVLHSRQRSLHHDSPSYSSTNIAVPETKEELKKGWDNGTVDCFHCSFSPLGHEPTNFRKFFDSATTAPYPVTYMEGFEPYLLVARESTPMYDERFRGYGKNKISHLYSCVHGHDMHLQVLHNAFIFEIPHPPSWSRRSYWGRHQDTETNLNRILGLYSRFKTEVKQLKMQRESL